MGQIRASTLRVIKAVLHIALSKKLGAKVGRLIAQERDVVRSAIAHAKYHDALVAAVGQVVRRGPFAGMTYARAGSAGSTLAPKLLGSYEAELHGVVADLTSGVRPAYDVVLDVGAAEGFYAVGLARLLPRARVIAFEVDPHGRALLTENVAANGVADRVDIKGACTPEAVAELARSIDATARVLILSDCEGAEYALLDPDREPGVRDLLGRADLLIELHRDASQTHGVAPREFWRERLARTHDLRWIDVAGRDPAQYPELAAIPFDQRQSMLFERTEDSGWLLAIAHPPGRG